MLYFTCANQTLLFSDRLSSILKSGTAGVGGVTPLLYKTFLFNLITIFILKRNKKSDYITHFKKIIINKKSIFTVEYTDQQSYIWKQKKQF